MKGEEGEHNPTSDLSKKIFNNISMEIFKKNSGQINENFHGNIQEIFQENIQENVTYHLRWEIFMNYLYGGEVHRI